MKHKVTVMPNKDSIYLSASLKLRSKKIEFIREVEISKDRMVYSLLKRSPDKNGAIQLHYDSNNKARQHAIIKQKRITEFMERVNPSNKWAASIEDDTLVLVPKVV